MTGAATKPIAVDGAEMFLGRAVVEELVSRRLPVRSITARPAANIPEGAEAAVAPLGDEAALAKAVDGARVVVAARKLLQERPREGLLFETVHAERTRKLLAAAEAAGVERFVHIGVAGVDRRPKDLLAKAEHAAEAYLTASKVPALSLRASLVVGPGDGHVSRLARRAVRRSPAMIFVGQGWARSAPITARDFGACVAAALLADDFPTGELSIGGPEALTAMQIQDRLLSRAGRGKLKVHVPESVAWLGAAIMEKLFRRSPVTRARMSWLLEDFVPGRVTSTKLLGRRPRRFETAFPGLVRERQNGNGDGGR